MVIAAVPLDLRVVEGAPFCNLNLPFTCSNVPAVPAYGVYISQLIRYNIPGLVSQSAFCLKIAAKKEATEPMVSKLKLSFRR